MQYADVMTDPRVPGASATLLSIAVVFRIVGAVWMVALSLLTMRVEPVGDGRDLIATAAGIAVVWTIGTVVAWLTWPALLVSPVWLAFDLAVAVFVALTPNLVGSAAFFVGGYPISSAILLGTVRGIPGGVLGGVAIASASALGAGRADARLAEVLAINLLTPVVVAWGFESIRKNDSRRRQAEIALEEERSQRIRADERAEVAAHLHDSVLQTLALIQRQNGDRAEVLRLARGQERELRGWLNGGETAPRGFTDSIVETAADIEASHGVVIEVSTVGDRPLDESGLAVVKATREALVNAAKFAGDDRIFVLAEARSHVLRVVIKDRGQGFDVTTIDDDRRGVRESIIGRMERQGGSATITSTPGEGTEIDLRLDVVATP